MSRENELGSPFQIQDPVFPTSRVKKHRIPDPQHCLRTDDHGQNFIGIKLVDPDSFKLIQIRTCDPKVTEPKKIFLKMQEKDAGTEKQD
jgi:hypothetical protein